MQLLKALVALSVVVTAGLSHGSSPTPAVLVPAVATLPAIDGELDDSAWTGPLARTGAFVAASGEAARPYSDARVAWTEDHLLVALYAADEDVRASGPARDAFRVSIAGTTFEVTARGELRGAPPGTRVGHDLDGTVDDPADEDEEWVIELAIPLASLGLHGRAGERFDFVASRCDTPRGAPRACATSRRLTLALGGRS